MVSRSRTMPTANSDKVTSTESIGRPIRMSPATSTRSPVTAVNSAIGVMIFQMNCLNLLAVAMCLTASSILSMK